MCLTVLDFAMRKLVSGRSYQAEFRDYNYLSPDVIRSGEAYVFRATSSVNDTRFHRGFYRRRCGSGFSARCAGDPIPVASLDPTEPSFGDYYLRDRVADPIPDRCTGKRMIDAREIVLRVENANRQRALSGPCRFFYSAR